MGKLFAWLFGSNDKVSADALNQLKNRVANLEEDVDDLGVAGEDHDARLTALEVPVTDVE